jgi:hypothetical protein
MEAVISLKRARASESSVNPKPGLGIRSSLTWNSVIPSPSVSAVTLRYSIWMCQRMCTGSRPCCTAKGRRDLLRVRISSGDEIPTLVIDSVLEMLEPKIGQRQSLCPSRALKSRLRGARDSGRLPSGIPAETYASSPGDHRAEVDAPPARVVPALRWFRPDVSCAHRNRCSLSQAHLLRSRGQVAPCGGVSARRRA